MSRVRAQHCARPLARRLRALMSALARSCRALACASFLEDLRDGSGCVRSALPVERAPGVGEQQLSELTLEP